METGKKTFLVWAAILLGAYFVLSPKSPPDREESRTIDAQTELATLRKERLLEVRTMVETTSAVVDWERKLLPANEDVRLVSILTVELERLWLTGRPILFRGQIRDVANLNEKEYRVTFVGGGIDNPLKYVGPELSLRCTKEMIDPFIGERLRFSGPMRGFLECWGNFAIVADIEEIVTTRRLAEGGGLEEVKTGMGRCIKLVDLGGNWIFDRGLCEELVALDSEEMHGHRGREEDFGLGY